MNESINDAKLGRAIGFDRQRVNRLRNGHPCRLTLDQAIFLGQALGRKESPKVKTDIRGQFMELRNFHNISNIAKECGLAPTTLWRQLHEINEMNLKTMENLREHGYLQF